jgi:hypothetical protein
VKNLYQLEYGTAIFFGHKATLYMITLGEISCSYGSKYEDRAFWDIVMVATFFTTDTVKVEALAEKLGNVQS